MHHHPILATAHTDFVIGMGVEFKMLGTSVAYDVVMGMSVKFRVYYGNGSFS